MVKVSRLADYALIIVTKMVTTSEVLYSATMLTQCTGLKLPTVRKVLKLLTMANILEAKRGVGGGYQLINAKNLALVNVIEAIDGKIALTECCDIGTDQCSVHDCCLQNSWVSINAIIRKAFSDCKIDQLPVKA